jgi:hypothetical protein
MYLGLIRWAIDFVSRDLQGLFIAAVKPEQSILQQGFHGAVSQGEIQWRLLVGGNGLRTIPQGQGKMHFDVTTRGDL